MRISTQIMYAQSTNSLNKQQSAYLNVGNQLASGKRVNVASDDPLAMSKAINISQSSSVNDQYTSARVAARNTLGQEENVLDSVSDAISSIKSLLVQASSDTLSDADRSSIASDLQGKYETLLGLANSADGNGRYLFGGYKDSSPPYVKDASGNVTYVGDNNKALTRVDSSRSISASDTGSTIFGSVIGSASMVATADKGNTGSVVAATPTIEDTSAAGYRTGFSIEFSEVAGAPYYSVDGGTPVAYTDGDKITVNGMGLTLSGTPAAGDKITVNAGGSGDMFESIKSAIDALNTTISTPADKAALTNSLRTSMNELTNNLDNVLTVTASVGARLNELDTLDTVGSNRTLNYKASTSALIDLDYNSALSEYSLRQVGLQAAQKAFVDIQSMSLFKMLN
ncbi:flagellar hook-associated protein FlgL [Pseudomonas putida]|uniref:Flagellar hook-associated protein FlgL n=1 Tax=Pseudomonas putida TaxID=303 RepID=A0A8I1EC40_PSEPU|nr:flagellar hook-associated protein FlgL [Pseudomonas putida]MBI6882559.1 flagellar hook-associated protein FlgL [Pseudomonas putida]